MRTAGIRELHAVSGKVAAALSLVALALSAVAIALFVAVPTAHATIGTVYACAVHPVYRHPVTSSIEDSGGSSAVATGQAMVESCVSSQGMLEATDTGEFYLTIRLSLIDLTSGHIFQVQEWGASGWSTPALGVTATGSDANGTTNDVCIELPSRNGIVRISMFVDSMGREVVFYAYADSFTEGAPSGFTPAIVTEDSEVAVSDSGDVRPSESGGVESETESADDLTGESVASSAQGLSLSTAPVAEKTVDESHEAEGSAQAGRSATVVEVAVAVFIVGVAFMFVAACIVYVFRRNWSRWGGMDPDDYSGAYRDA